MELNNNKTAPIVQEMDKNQLSLDLMHRMRLTGMATAFEESLTTTIADKSQDKKASGVIVSAIVVVRLSSKTVAIPVSLILCIKSRDN